MPPVSPATAYLGRKRNLVRLLLALVAATPHARYVERFVGMFSVPATRLHILDQTMPPSLLAIPFRDGLTRSELGRSTSHRDRHWRDGHKDSSNHSLRDEQLKKELRRTELLIEAWRRTTKLSTRTAALATDHRPGSQQVHAPVFESPDARIKSLMALSVAIMLLLLRSRCIASTGNALVRGNRRGAKAT